MSKGRIKSADETVEGWVGMGPKSVKTKSAKATTTASRKKKTKAQAAYSKKASTKTANEKK